MEYQKIRFSDFEKGNVTIKGSLFLISTPIFTYVIITPFSLILIVISWMIVYPDSYFFPSIILLILLFYQLWKIFDPINIIKINLQDKTICLYSRNPIKFIILGKNRYYFNDIKTFTISESSDSKTASRRFIIFANLKNLSITVITQTLKEKTANEIKVFLHRIIADT